MTEWISVKEKWPEEKGIYLIFYRKEVITALWSKNCMDNYSYTFDYYPYNPYDKINSCDVTHWAKMPKAPNTESYETKEHREKGGKWDEDE